jgi:hypothetical protein
MKLLRIRTAVLNPVPLDWALDARISRASLIDPITDDLSQAFRL